MELGRLDEPLLVRRCKEGSEAAYAELVRRHRTRLFSLAYRLLGDRESAEDAVQETFVAAFRAMDKFEPRPSLSAWLNTILLRLAGRAAARIDARPGTSLDAMAADESTGYRLASLAGISSELDPHAAAEAAELRGQLTAAIRALPFKYRAAVITRFVMDLDYAEAAASLEMGLNTYKSHLLRGTRMLRKSLGLSLRPAWAADAAAAHRPATRGPGASTASDPVARPVGTAVATGGINAVAAAPADASRAIVSTFADPRPRFSDRIAEEHPAGS